MLRIRHLSHDLAPGKVYGIKITPKVFDQFGSAKIIYFTTEPRRVANLRVGIENVACEEETYSPLMKVEWDQDSNLIDDAKETRLELF